MKSPKPFCSHAVLLSILLAMPFMTATLAQDAPTPSPDKTGKKPETEESQKGSDLLSPERIAAQIEQVKSHADLEEETKQSAVDKLNQTLSQLKKVSDERDRAEAFKKAINEAPAQAKKIREALGAEKSSKEPPTVELSPDEDPAVRLAAEKSELATAQEALAAREAELSREQSREKDAREEEAELRQSLEEIEELLSADPAKDEHKIVSSANRSELESRRRLGAAELASLAQEIYSRPMRLDLLEAEKDREAAKVAQLEARVKAFEDLVHQLRTREAEAAEQEAKRLRLEAASKHPVVQKAAEKNSALSEENSKVARDNGRATNVKERKTQEKKRLEQDFQHTSSQLDEAGLSARGGRFLRTERGRLPKIIRNNEKQSRRWQAEIPEVVTRRFEISVNLRELDDLDAAVSKRIAAAVEHPVENDERDEVTSDLRERLEVRKKDLEDLQANYNVYLATLGELKTAQDELGQTARKYASHLDTRLLWIPSSTPPNAKFFADLNSSLKWLFSPANWNEAMERFRVGVENRLPLSILAGLVLVGLLLGRRRLRQGFESTADLIGKPERDHFGLTIGALIATVLFVSPLPLTLASLGWILSTVDVDTTLPFVPAMGAGLLGAATVSFVFGTFRALCLPKGVATTHFRWREQTVKVLRTNITWARPIVVTTTFVMVMTSNQPDPVLQSSLGLLFFVVGMITQFIFLQRILHPRTGVPENLLRRYPEGWLSRLRYVWYPLAVGLPVVFVIAAILGYSYTAFELEHRVIMSARVLVGVIVLNFLALRWLVIAASKLAIQQAKEKRIAEAQAAEAATQAPEDAVETEKGTLEVPEIDISMINEQSKKLIRTTLAVVLALGIWAVWASVFPALHFLDAVELPWSFELESGNVPVTLEDLVFSLVVLVLSFAAAKNLPGVLEIIMIKSLPFEPSLRYAITTVSQYVLTMVGVGVAFHLVGIGWSKVQWLVAALSLGVGFGLQEIVANFFCGLILLFERPIRVGDIVTVGDVMGTVTKIRIRATTITNWDRMDYVVPNKELITGRLLNWTLSNTVNRIVVNVGVAYGSDIGEARKVLLETAASHPLIMKDPSPIATFEGFGDSTLNMVLRCYLPDFANRLETIHQLHSDINEAFAKAGLEIAFPQMDLHIYKGDPEGETS